MHGHHQWCRSKMSRTTGKGQRHNGKDCLRPFFQSATKYCSSQHHLSDDDITSLGKKNPRCNIVVYDVPFSVCLESTIQEFLTFYRSNFPAAKITTKRHLLEDHVCEFLRTWRVGFEMMGEQGAESIHAAYNNPKSQCPQKRDTIETC